MSDQNSNGQAQRLTPDDPVTPEQLNKLRLLQESRIDIADRFLTLEQEKIKLLAAARRVDEEKQRVFEGILLERGLTPEATVEIDAGTGKLRMLTEQPQVPVPQPQ